MKSAFFDWHALALFFCLLFIAKYCKTDRFNIIVLRWFCLFPFSCAIVFCKICICDFRSLIRKYSECRYFLKYDILLKIGTLVHNIHFFHVPLMVFVWYLYSYSLNSQIKVYFLIFFTLKSIFLARNVRFNRSRNQMNCIMTLRIKRNL